LNRFVGFENILLQESWRYIQKRPNWRRSLYNPTDFEPDYVRENIPESDGYRCGLRSKQSWNK